MMSGEWDVVQFLDSLGCDYHLKENYDGSAEVYTHEEHKQAVESYIYHNVPSQFFIVWINLVDLKK